MGKALVLKNGVDFSANAVTTIEFADIPCTGITFAQNTYTVSGYDDVTVEYTIAPADTTDSVIWTSSNTDVVSISNGVMTINGIGTCTITATCGAFTATATVTVNILYNGPYVANVRTRINTGLTPNIVTTSGGYVSRFTAYGDGSRASQFRAEKNNGFTAEELKAYKFPKNTAKIRISYDSSKSALFDAADSYVVFAKDEFCGNTSFPYAIKPISGEVIRLNTSSSIDVNVPSDSDSLFVCVPMKADITNVDEVITETGFKIEFIPAE